MDHPLFLQHDLDGEIDMDLLFTDSENLFNLDPLPLSASPPNSFANPSPDSLSSRIDEIEGILMNNDPTDEVGLEQPSVELLEKFLAGVLVDSPPEGCSEEFIDAQNDTSDSDVGSGAAEEEKLAGSEANDNDQTVEDADDPASKKLKRQLRNRDAAVRSRERKKLYVKDLEVKSRYLEGECRRLGRLLQCFMSENHALRLTLQNGSVATMTKQESAVLLMESLLLGSLLWFLGLTCLFNLPDGVVQENIGKRSLINEAPSEPRSKTYESLLLPCCMRSRRCRASKTRMRLISTLVL